MPAVSPHLLPLSRRACAIPLLTPKHKSINKLTNAATEALLWIWPRIFRMVARQERETALLHLRSMPSIVYTSEAAFRCFFCSSLAPVLWGAGLARPVMPRSVRRYRQSPMARSSGLIQGEISLGLVRHAASSMTYRVSRDAGLPQFQYRSSADERIAGKQELRAFIGSGGIGRSYLFRVEDWWFLAPVSYYSQRAAWDMSPGYEPDQRMHFSRRVTESCLNCHASGARSAPGSYNRFPDPPWGEEGVGCERCHGPGEAHVKHGGSIVNPAKLDAERRDSICAQCHLTGEERIERPGRKLSGFRPGERLSDYADYFVMAGAGMRATSHVERLAASRCKQRSGDRLWCGTCHSPHGEPPAQGRAAYFRAKCLGCHGPEVCRRGEDCAGCHMPRSTVIDAGHSVLTDHSIPRRPAQRPRVESDELAAFGGGRPSARALGLAYANLAIRSRRRRHFERAISLLEEAAPKDSLVLTQLGHWEEMRGRVEAAAALYEAALREDPERIVAAVNLGSLAARRGDLESAITLWRGVVERDPATTEAGLNLAVALRQQGKIEQARAILERVLLFDPASEQARRLLNP